MIADYFFIRKQKLVVDELYIHNGRYGYANGINGKAIIALLLGILPIIPGFLVQIKVLATAAMPLWLSHIYNYAWFVGFFVSGFVYLLLTKKEIN